MSTKQIIDCGSGPALVLLHGAGVDPDLWQPQLAQFSQTHRVIAPALPGHAGRPPVTSVEAMAEDVLHQLEGVAEFALVGLSLGGMVALEIAARCPERVTHLVLAESVPCVAGNPISRALMAGMLAILGRIPPRWMAWLPAKHLGAASPEAAAYLVARLKKTRAQDNRAVLKLALRYDGRRHLAQIKSPALVLVGALNRATHARARAMAQALPQARYTALADASHLVNWDARDAFNQTLSSFLGDPL